MSSKAKDSVLTNDYLLNYIFSYFNPGNERAIRKHKKHISMAALTCRAFVGPARNAQWYELPSLRSLFRFLETGWDEHVEEFSFSRHETADNIAKFRERARRVRILWYFPTNRRDSIPLSTEAIAQVADACTISGQRGFLPCLHTLHCCSPVDWLEDLSYLASPSLQFVHIHTDSYSSSFPVRSEAQLNYLSQMELPVLRRLAVETTFNEQSLRTISPFQSLTELSIDFTSTNMPTTQFLEDMSCLRFLEIIELDFTQFKYIDNRSSPFSCKCGSLSTLKRVHLNARLSGIADFMEGLEGATLTRLCVEIYDDPALPGQPSLQDVSRLGRSLAMAGMKSLRSLTIIDECCILPMLRLIGASNQVTDDGNSELLPSNAFVDILLQFQNLEKLQYYADHFHLSGTELDRILQSTTWRKTLQEFAMPRGSSDENAHTPREHTKPPPSLRQLSEIAHALPNVKKMELYVCLNGGAIPAPSLSGLSSVSRLEFLEIATEEFLGRGSIVPMAKYLRSIFPKLGRVKGTGWGQENLWRDVTKILTPKKIVG